MPALNENKISSDVYFAETENTENKTELINGEIVAMASPSLAHQKIIMRVSAFIDRYISDNKGECTVYPTVDVKLDDYNVVIPDISVICDSSKLNEQFCDGCPDWIIEVVSTNRADDFIRKLALYKEHGVREYWIVDSRNEKTLVYFFDESNFPSVYTFDMTIEVGIYKNNPVKLHINIAEIIK